MKAKHRIKDDNFEVAAEDKQFFCRTDQGVQIEDDRTSMSLQAFKRAFADNLYYLQGVDRSIASPQDYYKALSYTVRDRLMHRWIKTEQTFFEDKKAKGVFYLSAEFLMGRQLRKNLVNIGCWEIARKALEDAGLNIFDILEQEPDPGLGNGGLGRLAACFLDSLATLRIPAVGYGIRYEFGIFEQAIVDGWQIEKPDNWLLLGNPWEFPRPEYTVEVKFGGHTEVVDIGGREVRRWIPAWKVLGVPFDTLVPGYNTNNVNTLCLWSAKATKEFDFGVFNAGDYTRAVSDKTTSENISKVLYPNDNTPQGQELRLQQQYFFVSCSLQDIIRVHLWKHGDFDNFAELNAVQLNDTHPAIAVPELMRLLLDELRFDWDEAWKITTETLAFTNHTLLPEALERWPIPLFERLLPRHLEIIYEINRRHIEAITVRFPGDEQRIERMSLIEEGWEKQIRMGNLATIGSHSVNGVAALHSQLVKDRLLKDFYELSPEKFNNKTNGITPRRWLLLSNPKLSALITEKIDKDWITDLSQLSKLAKFTKEKKFVTRWARIKHENKEDLAEYIKQTNGIEVNPDSIFDIQVKRIHEYKRQLLNCFHIINLYNRIKADPTCEVVPRTFIFGGKAAPGYLTAKRHIKLINNIAKVVNNDPDVDGRIKVVFLPNFSVTVGQRVYPAADLSEQISTAGMEASGTGNMKFSLNGALTIGTLDGANIEIREEVGEENFFLFGNTVSDIDRLRHEGYNPRDYYHGNDSLRAVVDAIANGTFSDGDRELFAPDINFLLNDDFYMICADYQAYIDCQAAVAETYKDSDKWHKMSILNAANMGKFSSDRTIQEYCDDIWKVKPLEVKLADYSPQAPLVAD